MYSSFICFIAFNAHWFEKNSEKNYFNDKHLGSWFTYTWSIRSSDGVLTTRNWAMGQAKAPNSYKVLTGLETVFLPPG